jgi:Ca2+-binding RTX toxin-like protein
MCCPQQSSSCSTPERAFSPVPAKDAITGGHGNDTLAGNAGNDRLVGGDIMLGGTGNDIYEVDYAGDVVIEGRARAGMKSRLPLSSYTLGANLEDLNFYRVRRPCGIGNDVANAIQGKRR